MGTNAVGGMIVAGKDGFMKSHYRTFNISTDTIAGDDFGMMREVLQRRFARLAKEAGTNPTTSTDSPPRGGEELEVARAPLGEGSPSGSPPIPLPSPPGGREAPLQAAREDEADDSAFPSRPDLVIVDGGKGQFEAARKIMAELGGSDVPLVAIAKGADRNAMRETFFMAGREPFKLPPRDPALYFIQRLRDEAHRFAIGTHRAKRKRDTMTNPLDEIPGIGPSRKRALLLHFGTVKAIQRAKLDDLMRTPGVNAATAKAVHDHFHEH
jgi:excinuclease ABC subunit C